MEVIKLSAIDGVITKIDDKNISVPSVVAIEELINRKKVLESRMSLLISELSKVNLLLQKSSDAGVADAVVVMKPTELVKEEPIEVPTEEQIVG